MKNIKFIILTFVICLSTYFPLISCVFPDFPHFLFVFVCPKFSLLPLCLFPLLFLYPPPPFTLFIFPPIFLPSVYSLPPFSFRLEAPDLCCFFIIYSSGKKKIIFYSNKIILHIVVTWLYSNISNAFANIQTHVRISIKP